MSGFMEKVWRESWEPVDRRPIYETLSDDLILTDGPYPGPFDINNSPWIREPLDAIARDHVRRVSVSGAAQLAKTLLGIVFIIWIVLKRPGLTTWNGQTDQSIKKFAEDKAWPMFRQCRRLLALMPGDKNKQRIRSIVFPHMSLRFQAASENNAHGDTVSAQVNDERHLWLPGLIHKFRSRTGSMPTSKTLDLSTGSVKFEDQELPDGSIIELGDDFFNDWQAGSRKLWSVKCPGCARVQPLAFQHRHFRTYRGDAEGPADGSEVLDAKNKPVFGIVWDETETTRPGGRWNYGAVKRTARWRCCADALRIPGNGPCSFEVADHPDEIRALNSIANGACYVATNPLADPAHETFSWPAMVSELVGFGTLVAEWLAAIEAAKAGDYLPLKTFTQNRLGLAWNENITIQEASNPTGDYTLGDDWFDAAGVPQWHRIFLVVDVQEKKGRHYWALVRGYTADGKSRLIFYGKLESWEAIRALQLEHAVQDGHTAIDAGDGNNFHEILSKCAEFGWIALQGRDQQFFAHANPKSPKQPLNKLWGPKQLVDPARGAKKKRGAKATKEERVQQQVAALAARLAAKEGKPAKRFARLYRWSNPGVKDILARLLAGAWKYWGRPNNEPPEYTDQLASEIKKQVATRDGGKEWRWTQIKPDNHARDCEAMCTLLALMSGILTPEAAADPAPAQPGIMESAAKILTEIAKRAASKIIPQGGLNLAPPDQNSPPIESPRIDPPLTVPSSTRKYRMRTPEEKEKAIAR